MFMNMLVLFCHIRCLSDSKRTGANSFFLQRSEEDELQFQLKAFRFNQDKLGNNSVGGKQCVLSLKNALCVFSQQMRRVSNFRTLAL